MKRFEKISKKKKIYFKIKNKKFKKYFNKRFKKKILFF